MMYKCKKCGSQFTAFVWRVEDEKPINEDDVDIFDTCPVCGSGLNKKVDGEWI